MAPCKTCRLQPTALPDYYYATKLVSTFYLITLLHAYLSNYHLGSSLRVPPVISYSKKKINLFSVRTFNHATHYLSHGLHDYTKVLRSRSAAGFFFLISQHRRCGVWRSECIAGKRNKRKRGKQKSTGKYIYIFREKISCVNPIVEHFSFTV